MSLWYKRLADVTFDDIDAFCERMQPEGARLDYKGVAFPADLDKTIASFANTLGGLIILGVDADPETNTPIWPPKAGLASARGLSERVGQIAHEAIYPPVRISMSPVINNEHLPGHSLLVIRVDESRDAPHAVEKNRKVYVYDRTHNRNQPYQLADVGRIDQLLLRRRRIVDRRESDLQECLARSARMLMSNTIPTRWVAISPIYPWQDVRDPLACSEWHRNQWHLNLWSYSEWTHQTFVGGSLGVARHSIEDGARPCVGISSVAAVGSLFCEMCAHEVFIEILRQSDSNTRSMNLRNLKALIKEVIDGCISFFGPPALKPGELMISIGIRNAMYLMMYDTENGKKSNAPFPDDRFRFDRVFSFEQITTAPEVAIAELIKEITFAFNAHAEWN